MAQIITGKDVSERKMLPPGKVKALGVPELILNQLTDRIETGVKLVPVDIDRRMEKYTSVTER